MQNSLYTFNPFLVLMETLGQHDALIFDIDGTLWSASHATAVGFNAALAHLGIDIRITEDDIQSVTGKPFEECVHILLPNVPVDFALLRKTLDAYETEAILQEGGRLYAGVAEGIKTLSQTYKIFLVSNCQGWYLQHFIYVSGLGEYLSGADCYGLSGVGKEHMFRTMVEQYHLKNPIYIGDTLGDEAAAMAAGIPFVHVAYGFGTALHTPWRVDSFSELVQALAPQTTE